MSKINCTDKISYINEILEQEKTKINSGYYFYFDISSKARSYIDSFLNEVSQLIKNTVNYDDIHNALIEMKNSFQEKSRIDKIESEEIIELIDSFIQIPNDTYYVSKIARKVNSARQTLNDSAKDYFLKIFRNTDNSNNCDYLGKLKIKLNESINSLLDFLGKTTDKKQLRQAMLLIKLIDGITNSYDDYDKCYSKLNIIYDLVVKQKKEINDHINAKVSLIPIVGPIIVASDEAVRKDKLKFRDFLVLLEKIFSEGNNGVCYTLEKVKQNLIANKNNFIDEYKKVVNGLIDIANS